jgi:hypothetical protein
MALATSNRNAIQAASGQVFLAAALTALAGATTADKVKALYVAAGYADGDIRNDLTAGVTPWAVLDKNGYKDKITGKEIKIDPNDSAEETIGLEDIAYTGEITIYDVDVQHMKDVLSAAAANVISTVASATMAGRETLIAGGQRILTDYMLLYRYPSRKAPGEFNNILVPKCSIAINADRENSKGKARDLKITINAKGFDLLPDPATNLPSLWLEDFVINPKV